MSAVARQVNRIKMGRTMKVLMVNWPDALHYRGGDLTVMRQTAAALRAFGVEAAESFEAEPDAAGFDLAHVFNLRTVQATRHQVRHLKRADVPVVLSPIFFDTSQALWAVQAIAGIFGCPRADGERDRLLDELRSRRLWLKTEQGQTLSADSANRPFPDYDEGQREILRSADHLLPCGHLEISQLMKTLRVYDLPFTVVPYGADARTFLDADPGPFVRKYGLRDFVLQVGRVEGHKNQLLLAYALRDLDLPLVLIGGQQQAPYVEWCRHYGPKGLRLIPYLSAEELPTAYAAARVHVLAGWAENCGLVSLEAALAGCSVVASTAGFEVEYFRDLVYYCDPGDVASIRRAVREAYANYERDAPRRLRLRELILHEYTWERAAERTFHAYRQALACRGR